MSPSPARSGQGTNGSPAATEDRAVGIGTLGRALAVVRILIGMTFLLNGLAKVFGIHRVEIGPYVGHLINRADARFILDVEVNNNARHQVPLIGRITNDLVLPHWEPFSWGLTVVEVGAGALLVLGLASRLGAVLAAVPSLFLLFVYLANDRWLFEKPLELVPLALLVLIPSGRWWGLDRRLAGRGWPF